MVGDVGVALQRRQRLLRHAQARGQLGLRQAGGLAKALQQVGKLELRKYA